MTSPRPTVSVALTIALTWMSAAGAGAQVSQAGAGRRFTIDDMAGVVRLSDPRLSPDGRAIALVVARADTTHDTWTNELVLVDVSSGARRALTYGRKHVGTPRWSPDGDRLAFTAAVKTGDDEVPQVFVMPMAGGDARQLTAAPMGVQQFAWRPNGRDIAYVAADEPVDKNAHKTGHDGFEISSNDFLTGETPTPAHIWLVSADSGAARRLTSGPWSLPISFPPGPPSSPLSWSPDGATIAFTRQERPYAGETEKTTIQLLDVATGAMHPLTTHRWLEAFPQWSPDGGHVAYLYNRDGDILSFTDAFVTTPTARAEGVNRTQRLDRMFYRILWLPNGRSMLVGANDGDRVSLWEVPLDGEPRKLSLGAASPANPFWLDADVGRTGAVAFIGSEATRPSELYYMASTTAPVRRLTDFNGAMSAFAFGTVETFTWTGPPPDRFSENGIVVYPPGFEATKKYPLVLFVHGGPVAASLQTFSPPTQAIAARGYIVFSPNYRGSDNLGNRYSRTVYGDAGDGPGKDVMAGLALLERRPYIDTTRVFVTGTSYGGYMTTWLIGHYSGWRAAVAGAAVTDLADEYNFGDANVNWGYFIGGSPWKGASEKLVRDQSPITYVHNIRTPTLITSTTGDVRVPVTQSYKLYRALTDLGVETKFVAWPVGGHGPGDPVRLMDWYRRWLDWIDRHDRSVTP